MVARKKRRLSLFVVLVLLSAAVFLLAASTTAAAAQENDDGAPSLEDGERANVSSMRVTIADDRGVNVSSISAADFALSDGEIAAVNVSERGSNAEVVLALTDRLRVNDVTVAIAEDGNITDTSGNALRNGSVTVTGMDSVYPVVREFEVQRVNDTAGRVVLVTNEPLSSLQVGVDGPNSTAWNLSRFETARGRFPDTYATTYRFPRDGEYEVRLESMTDTSGLRVNRSDVHTFVRDGDDPTAVIDGPRHAETGDTVRFDGSESADTVGIEQYEWVLDGNHTGNGPTFEHAFTEPGTHTVSLTTVDGRENDDSTEWTVTVHDAPGKEGVDVRDANGTGVRVTVGGDRTAERVRIADESGRLVGEDGVELHSLTLSLPTNETAEMNVSANATDPSFESATGESGLAAFTVDHGNQSVESPTFRFAVSSSRLSRAGVSFADVSLYRDDGDWTELDTEVVRASRSTVVYEAESPGLSTFVVGGTSTRDGTAGTGPGASGVPAEEPSIRVSEASLERASVGFGDVAVVEATLVNEGATGTSVAGVTLGSETVASRPVTVPANESRSVALPFGATDSGTVAVNGTVAGDLTVTGGGETDTGDAASGNPAETASEADDSESGVAGTLRDIPVPNPLALWPDGLLGTILAGVVGLVVGTYAILKALAIYLGY